MGEITEVAGREERNILELLGVVRITTLCEARLTYCDERNGRDKEEERKNPR